MWNLITQAKYFKLTIQLKYFKIYERIEESIFMKENFKIDKIFLNKVVETLYYRFFKIYFKIILKNNL